MAAGKSDGVGPTSTEISYIWYCLSILSVNWIMSLTFAPWHSMLLMLAVTHGYYESKTYGYLVMDVRYINACYYYYYYYYYIITLNCGHDIA